MINIKKFPFTFLNQNIFHHSLTRTLQCYYIVYIYAHKYLLVTIYRHDETPFRYCTCIVMHAQCQSFNDKKVKNRNQYFTNTAIFCDINTNLTRHCFCTKYETKKIHNYHNLNNFSHCVQIFMFEVFIKPSTG